MTRHNGPRKASASTRGLVSTDNLAAYRRRQQQKKLTRSELLLYIAEMSEQMATLADNVKCANLADQLLSAANTAHGEMLENRRPNGRA